MTDRADAKKSQPTRADREAAAKLKLLWDAKWKGLGKTQADFLEAGKLAWSQSTVSQYINGKITVRVNERPYALGRHTASIELEFRCQ